MSESALAEKQQPRWAVSGIEPESPSQERPGPSDVLQQSRQYLKLFTAGVLSGTQTHKRRFFYQLNPSAESQRSTDFKIRWQHVTYVYDIKTSRGTTSGWHDLGESQINWEHVQPIPETQGATEFRFVEISKGPSSFAIELSDVSSPVQASSPANILQKRYKELNSKDYLGTLTAEDKIERERIEQQLDELDAHDPDLKSFATQIEQGYNKLRRGLTEVNRILDELLSH
jgi:hypothetical protein